MSNAVQAKLAAMRAFNGVMGALKKHRETSAPQGLPAGGAHAGLHAGQGLPIVATQGFSAHDIEELGGRVFAHRRQPVCYSSCTSSLAFACAQRPCMRARTSTHTHGPQGTRCLPVRGKSMKHSSAVYARVCKVTP